MKRKVFISLAMIYSLNVLGWELTVPATILVEPSCSDWNYSECSIEVSGQMYYQFTYGFGEVGDFDPEAVSINLDFDDCTEWTYDTNIRNEEVYTFNSTATGYVELTIWSDDDNLIPGDHEIITVTVSASSTLNGIYTGKSEDIDIIVESPTLDGSWPICYSGSETFEITSEIPSDVSSVDFEISSNLYEISSTSNSVTVRAQNSSTSGTGWIKPKYYMNCSEWRECPKTDVYVGKFTNEIITGTTGVCPDTYYTYTFQVPLGDPSDYTYSWSYPSNWMWPIQDDNWIRIKTPIYNPQYGVVSVNITNACGTANSGITVYPGYCGGYFMASPNPATSYLEIDIVQTAKSLQADLLGQGIVVKVFDKMGTAILIDEVKSLPYQIDASTLKNGNYVVYIMYEKNTQALQILVDH